MGRFVVTKVGSRTADEHVVAGSRPNTFDGLTCSEKAEMLRDLVALSGVGKGWEGGTKVESPVGNP